MGILEIIVIAGILYVVGLFALMLLADLLPILWR